MMYILFAAALKLFAGYSPPCIGGGQINSSKNALSMRESPTLIIDFTYL
jgi:hypothetical protein